MKPTTVARTIRFSAVYDLVVTSPFALPLTAPLAFAALGAIHGNLGLRGAVPSADDVFALLFANLLGAIVTVWSIFRIWRPTFATGVADTAARILFSIGMASALIRGASPITGVLLGLEIAWAVAQMTVLARAARGSKVVKSRNVVEGIS